jgi:hypothetical protein
MMQGMLFEPLIERFFFLFIFFGLTVTTNAYLIYELHVMSGKGKLAITIMGQNDARHVV